MDGGRPPTGDDGYLQRGGLAKAADVVERLAEGRPTNWAQAKGEAVVAHYLDPSKSPARGRACRFPTREEQQAYCERSVIPVESSPRGAGSPGRVHFARILAQARTASVASHLRPCSSAMVAAELEEGLLLARQDVPARDVLEPAGGPDSRRRQHPGTLHRPGRHPHGQRCGCPCLGGGEQSRLWWRELQVLVVAYSGLHCGEMAALTADRVDASRRRVVVDRQVVETRHQLCWAAQEHTAMANDTRRIP